MDMVNLITSLGFPVAACLALGLYVKYTNDQSRQDRKESETSLHELTERATEAIKNNTVALMRILDRLGGGIEDDNK